MFVQDQNGQPLLPTQRSGMVRRWLQSGRARVVRQRPFTIRLGNRDGGYTQPLEAGVDLGTAHVGMSVVSPDQTDIVAAVTALAVRLDECGQALETAVREYRAAVQTAGHATENGRLSRSVPERAAEMDPALPAPALPTLAPAAPAEPVPKPVTPTLAAPEPSSSAEPACPKCGAAVKPLRDPRFGWCPQCDRSVKVRAA